MQQSDGDRAEQSGLPLFYSQPEALNPDRHRELKLRASSNMGFAQKTNAIPLTATEFFECARFYPIVFVGQEDPFAAAIVGLRGAENLLIDPDGVWEKRSYIPAYVRRYPFVFVQNDTSDQFTLCIDRASDRVNAEDGDGFFDGDTPSDMTKRALDFCSAFQRQYTATRGIIKQFTELDLLISNQGMFRLQDGQTVTLRDFKVIDQERFNALSADQIAGLHSTGALAAAYAQLLSMRTWDDLVARIG